jgi:hypothetical protein
MCSKVGMVCVISSKAFTGLGRLASLEFDPTRTVSVSAENTACIVMYNDQSDKSKDENVCTSLKH